MEETDQAVQRDLSCQGSTLEIIPQNEKGKSYSMSRQRLQAVLKFGVPSILAVTIVIFLVLFIRSESIHSMKESANPDNKSADKCAVSSEARRVQLAEFLAKVKETYYELRPYEIATKPGLTVQDFMKLFRPYDPRPTVIKSITDEGNKLHVELTGIMARSNGTLLRPREKKALSVARSILRDIFGWAPYSENYYGADWMLGPNLFCWQPICNSLDGLQLYLSHFKPSNVSDLERLKENLELYNASFRQYMRNMRLGVNTGMVRSQVACRAGLHMLKLRYLSFAPLQLYANETGKYKQIVYQSGK